MKILESIRSFSTVHFPHPTNRKMGELLLSLISFLKDFFFSDSQEVSWYFQKYPPPQRKKERKEGK